MQRFDIVGVIADPDYMYELFFGEPEPGCTGITALKKFLSETEDSEIEIVINSPGGDAQMGLDMHDALVMSGKTIHTRVEGICYSAATPSLLAAKKENRSMAENSTIGIHLPYIPPYTLAGAYTADELQSLADGMRVFEDLYVNVYASATGKSVEELRALMVAETIMSAEKAIELGFVGSMIKTNIVGFKQLKAVAFINQKNIKMEKNQEIQEKISAFDKLMAKIEAWFVKAEAEPVIATPAEPVVVAAVITQEDLDAVTAENETLKAKVTELETKITDLEATIAELETAKAEATAKIAETATIKAEFATLKAEVATFKSTFKPEDRSQHESEVPKTFEEKAAAAIERSRARDAEKNKK
jgi:ATP-dependent protease ClpP protease subunit/cell division protein ZapA (FtsZ GTPase activity inhibitor)